MSDNKALTKIRYWIHTVTPLHVGAGRGLGYIDLPVAREKVTNWPYVPGSSVKGVIADHWGASKEETRNREENKRMKAAFGTAGSGGAEDEGGNAGALVFTDARLLCLPVRSFYGTFAWISSPFCLERFKRDMGVDVPIPKPQKDGAAVTKGSRLGAPGDAKIYLEDLDLEAADDGKTDALAKKIAGQVFADDPDWQDAFKERFAVVDDDIFTFLCEAGTEVTPHIRISEETGVAASGALWYEEALPAETILTGQVWCDKVYGVKDVTQADLFESYCGGTQFLQVGGKASTGKGQVRCVFEPLDQAGGR